MKQLLRYTSTLLRTAFLLGVLAFVNTPQAIAQIAGLPDAFETMDFTAIIGNGQYYYIQFFDGDENSMTRCYLSDQGAGNNLRSKDYLPFAKNIQWTLESAGGTNFYLKSALGNYVKLDGTNYQSTSSQGEATPLTVYKMPDGSHYEISTVANPANAMYRDRGRVWTDIIDGSHIYDHQDHHMTRCYLRIARLKDNIAHIIYYQDPQGFDANGEYRGGAEGFAKRHYLTSSGTGAQEGTNNWTSVITNGDMSGEDVSSFYIGNNQPATIEDGIGRMGGRGIAVNSEANQSQAWNTQFFVRASNVIGNTTVHLEFDYKASREVNNIQVQAKTDAFDSYITHIGAIGGLAFTTSWQHYSGDFSVTTGNNNEYFKMIAFDLGMTGDQAATTFYFDNIVFSVRPTDFRASDVSSRSSVLDSYDAWTIPTAAKYHEDGLWTLEKGNDVGDGAEFYIKRYGTSQYMNPVKDNDDVSPSLFYCVLGNQDNNLGRYVLEQPNNNRFTRIRNNTSGWGYTRHLSYSNGDGWPAMQLNEANTNPNFWQAGFLPVEVPAQDDNYRVLLGVTKDKKTKRTDSRIKLTGATKNPTIVPAEGSTLANLYGATFTPSEAYTNVIQYKNFQTGCYEKIVIKFGSAVPNGWHIHTYGGQFDNLVNLNGMTEYVVDLTGEPITDFTIFNWDYCMDPITITECYFTPIGPEPDCTPVPTEMLNHDGTTTAYTTDPASRKVWELEQVNDYGHFRLKVPNGQYFQDMGQMTDDANNAAIFTNESLLEYFDVKWFYVSSVMNGKEIPATDKKVTHKMSYLREYADDYGDLDLSKQGLASDKDSDWWDNDKKTQKTNHFEITHYVKQGQSLDVYFPTILDGSNDHINYQRWYKYGEDEDHMDLDNLKAHISLDTPDEVQYYLYKNGIVTGNRLYWEPTSYKHNAQDHIIFTNSDGQPFTLAADVSRYSDYKYEDSDNPLSGDLEEPTLTMRYIYYMKDAKEMASDLSQNKYKWTSDADTDEDHWKEKKTFHFPAKQVFYNDNKWEGYRGEFIGLRHVFSDYWVFDGSGTGNENLISAVNDGNASGKIEVKIYDPHETGIRLGGYNPYVNPRDDGAIGAPQVGDKIRVYYSDKKSNFYPIFKHSYNSGGSPADWTELQQTFNDVDNSYFEATIQDQATANELTAQGLRFQGRGFTITRIDIVTTEQSYSTFRNTSTIWTGNTVFDNEDWNTILSINRNNIRVNISNPVLADNYYQGFYFYDKMNTAWGAAPNGKTQYGDSRFIVFRYPKGNDGKTAPVTKTGIGNEVYLHVYFKVNESTKYQLAQFTLIFDEGCETLPWKSVNGSDQVYETDRDPVNLRKKAGNPIAKITFDYPQGDTYHYPSSGTTRHHTSEQQPGGTIANSSPLPLTFDHTNYSFDGDGCNWAAYAMVTQKDTEWGNNKMTYPADHETAGYNIAADKGMQQGFLYIDASEQPGDICAMDFQGEFCEGDKLMCTGWITGSNRYSDNGAYRCPGGITLTVKGEPLDGGDAETIYRFCPGQCYELDNGTGTDGSDGADKVVWQQFYFEFSTTKKFRKYWMEVNNNCVSSNGGDFMLDNVEVYAFVPEVIPEMNTPFCISKNASEMQLLKINIGFDKILAATNSTEVTGDASGVDKQIAFVFLEKDKFLSTFKKELADRGITTFGTPAQNITTELLDIIIEEGTWSNLVENNDAYKGAYRAAFDVAMLGNRKVWDSSDSNTNKDAGVLNFHWNTKFSEMEQYTFAKAVNRLGSVFREVDPESGERKIVMNGNYPNELNWKINTDYYIVPYNSGVTSENVSNDEIFFGDFNICSTCSKKRVFQIKPPLNILSLENSDETQELEVCEGKIPTLLADLTGYDINGNLVSMKDLNFDWWLGDKTTGVLATLDNYHNQEKEITYKDEHGATQTEEVHLDVALSTLRAYYKDATNLDGIIEKLSKTPNLTRGMTLYLQELVDAGQLVLHQKSISIPAEKSSEEEPYFYLVACPIHDEKFDQALLYVDKSEATPKDIHVAYFCDEPQGLRMKIGEKAPTLKCGFVPGENGFDSYDYSTVNDAILSIRLAKTAQFKTVQHGEENEAPEEPSMSNAETAHYLWLPIRNAETETASGVIRKSSDYDIYLASTNDPIWDKNIYTAMTQDVPSLPVVGKIVQLTAINTKGNINIDRQNAENRLCIYFTENFEVREGYSYTLSLPFQEEGNVNACDGTMLINMKIVPDYEVWTGAAGNTDWNNDENWRRADYDELYAGNGTTLKDEYKTNNWNYRTAKDRLFRKGFAPLYCTHVLMKSDEWGDAPVLYDALDGEGSLSSAPFPNLRDRDNWDGEGAEATATSILKFDLQARKYDDWKDTYGVNPDANKGREGDLLSEMYQMNSCDEIAFQPATELRNAHLLNYNNAWVEYKLNMARWYLLGSPLQGTIAGEWYAPTGNAQQQTTYFEDVTFGTGYDRYSPAIYQRSWDKAKAILYEVGSTYNTGDNPDDLELNQGSLPGSTQQGTWDNGTWNVTGADSYLARLGYKPISEGKVNVAMKGIWSNTYNDATVDYTKGGFSVMVLNNLKGGSNNDPAIVRLPKEDVSYKYWSFDKDESGTDTNLEDVQQVLNRAKNRGRLKTDLLLPESTQKQEKEAGSYKYGDRRTYTRVPIKEADLTTMIAGIRNHQESVSAGISNMGYYLVENPFPCGMDMDLFFDVNTGLEEKYWLLTNTGQHLVQKAEESNEWIVQEGDNFVTANAVVAPGQGFFVQATTPGEATTITFNKSMQAQSRYGEKDAGTDYDIVVGTRQVTTTEKIEAEDGTKVEVTVPVVDNDGNYVIEEITDKVKVYSYVQTSETDKKYSLRAAKPSDEEEAGIMGLVITAQRDEQQSSALVMQRKEANNDFLPSEDTEAFINSDLQNIPMVYTLCGRLATTINSIHDFRCLPLGVESASDAACTLTFRGVETLGDSIAIYDAVEQKLTPLESGMQMSVSGQTQNRYYIVKGLDLREAAEETHLQIFAKGKEITVIASTQEPISSVRCFDTAGRLVYSANPQAAEYRFSLQSAGVYIIDAQTDSDRKTQKVMTK